MNEGQIKSILNEVLEERRRQHAKWGEQNHDIFKWLAILGEEVGEANKAALDIGYGSDTKEHLINELIQAIAVGVQIIEALEKKSVKEAVAS